MSQPTTYEIVLRGRPSTRLLRPLLDDFTIDTTTDSVTRLVGDICDPAHLHGVVAHLTSVNVELISIAPHHSPNEERPTRMQCDRDSGENDQ
jgi:hypothetical protein